MIKRMTIKLAEVLRLTGQEATSRLDWQGNVRNERDQREPEQTDTTQTH